MKATIVTLMALATLVIVGCGSPKGGGMSNDEGFRLSTPLGTTIFATTIKQGDRKTVTVSVKRDEHFKQDVRLQATASPGISVEPSNVLVKASDSPDVQLQITAPPNAALGEYQIHVNAIPETGQATSMEIKVEVVKP